MLIDISFNQNKINQIISNACKENPDIDFSKWYDINNFCNRIVKGIYLTELNFNHYIDLFSDGKIKEDSYSFSPIIRENYGVCDSYEQVLKKYPELEYSNEKFIVLLCKIQKEEQPLTDGWRWCKWGEYIGTQNSQAEYLYNEPEIESIYVYHIYEME